MERPKYPTYALQPTRTKVFRRRPTNWKQTPQNLATAGFLYAGFGKDPRGKHTTSFPTYALLKQNNGDEFSIVQIEHQEQKQDVVYLPSSSLQLGGTTNRRSHQNIFLFPPVQSVLEMGYTLAVATEAFNQVKTIKDPRYITVADLMDFILTKEEINNGLNIPPQILSCRPQAREENIQSNTNDTKPLIDEIKRLKDQRLCKICLVEEASIVLLPCGHLCSCLGCALPLRNCPICRHRVEWHIKAWMP